MEWPLLCVNAWLVQAVVRSSFAGAKHNPCGERHPTTNWAEATRLKFVIPSMRWLLVGRVSPLSQRLVGVMALARQHHPANR